LQQARKWRAVDCKLSIMKLRSMVFVPYLLLSAASLQVALAQPRAPGAIADTIRSGGGSGIRSRDVSNMRNDDAEDLVEDIPDVLPRNVVVKDGVGYNSDNSTNAGPNIGTNADATSDRPGSRPGVEPGVEHKCLKLDPYTGIGKEKISNFNFPDADIVEIAETLGRITCLNFIFDKDVKGRISIVNNSKITVGDAWKAFLTALDVNGFTIIPSGQFLRISRQRDAKDKQLKMYSEDSPNTDLFITRVLSLKYISAEEVARTLRNFMPVNSRIIAYEQTNTLIITDTGANVKKLSDMIDLLDVARYDETFEVIRIKHASAQEIATLLDQMLPSGPAGGGGAPGAVPGLPRMNTGFSSALSGVRKTKEGGVISKVIPDARTNSLIVSANEQGLAQVRALVSKLDRKISNNTGGGRVNVIYLQYADAESVANTLTNLASGGGARAQAPGQPAPGSGAPTAALFEGNVRVSPDKATNSLVITGSQSDFVTMNQVIAKLDVPRDQVYVEAIIMELTADRNLEVGTSIAAPNVPATFTPNNDLGSFLVNPLSIPGLALGFQAGGGARSFTIPGTNNQITVKSVQGLIKALQTNSNANVLATPQLLTLDNQEASIEIGENIPIPTQTTAPNSGIVAQSVTYQKVALNLKLKPQINKASDFVKLDIDQKLEDISNRAPPKGVADLAFSTSSRAAKTTVVVQDGDTAVIGGLVRDRVTETATKIPLLGDIPLLGWLFRSKTSTSLKQNLLVFITPQIVKQYEKVRGILDQKIRQRDEFIERSMGGEDPLQQYKHDMIRSLPPVSTLRERAKKAQALETIGNPEVADDDSDENGALDVSKVSGPKKDGQQGGVVPNPNIKP